jgi:ABC-type lipoprotein release transport system permease subunit
MKLYLRLAWRNIWRNRRRTLIIFISIAFTMALMMWYDGIVAGFENAIYGNAIKVLGGNIQIHASGFQAKLDQNPLLPLDNDTAVIDEAMQQPQVVAASRRIKTNGMVINREGAFGVTIVGIEPELELPVSLPAQNVVSGRYLTAQDNDQVFIGKGLAEAMSLVPGDRITLVGKDSHQQMRQRSMTVAGIFNLDMVDIEKRYVYISLAEAQDLYGLNGGSTEIMISLERLGQESGVIDALTPKLSGYEIASWETNYPELKAAITSKSAVMDLFGIVIIGVVGIGIFNLLMMAVYERTREIGLLGALGLKSRQISYLFLLEGALIGLVGVVMGIGLGLLINLSLQKNGMDYSQFSGMTSYAALLTTRIYPSLGLERIVTRTLTVLVITTIAAIFPAREAAQREPAQALHYV